MLLLKPFSSNKHQVAATGVVLCISKPNMIFASAKLIVYSYEHLGKLLSN